jgi:hypothetical protein
LIDINEQAPPYMFKHLKLAKTIPYFNPGQNGGLDKKTNIETKWSSCRLER